MRLVAALSAVTLIGLGAAVPARATTYDFSQAANLLFTGSQFSPSRQIGYIEGIPLIVTVDSADADTCVISVRTNAPGTIVYRTYYLNNVSAKDLAISAQPDGLTTSLSGSGIIVESYSDPSSDNFTKFNPQRETSAKVDTPVPLPIETIEDAWASIYPRYCKGT